MSSTATASRWRTTATNVAVRFGSPSRAKADALLPKPVRAGLGPAGRRLWRGVWAGFELDPVEAAILGEACHVVDTTDALRDALVDAEPTVAGSTGQARINPLYAEIRAQQATLGRLCRAIGLSQAAPAEPARRPALWPVSRGA